MKRKKLDFTKTKDVRKAISSVAKTMSAYKKNFGSDSLIVKAVVKDVSSALGDTPFNNLFKENTTGFVMNKGKELDKYVDKMIKFYSSSSSKKDIYNQSDILEHIINGTPLPAPEKTIDVVKGIKNAYENIKTLTEAKAYALSDLREGLAGEMSDQYEKLTVKNITTVNPLISKEKAKDYIAAKKEELITSVLDREAKFILGLNVQEADNVYNIMSEAIDRGLAGSSEYYDIVHHEGRKATYSEISELASAIEGLYMPSTRI